ncbi:replication protein A, subunit RPA32 [Ascobolus immersus RN42]|uniref:Replication protein A, subunit RPA32 n=1 Tax=Ascobolus immersus RN42 TaxID=1160509 RepID=A0A3N4IBI2_ASCIM|nr:replication protein A, subunit RPA32 [Ascobolus immersus RN42]
MAYSNYGGNDGGFTTTGAYGGGGGFTSFGGGTQVSGTQGTPGGKTQKSFTLRPVTIKQLNDAEQPIENDFRIDDVEVTHVTFIGQIRNISPQPTNILYKMDDGTGTIEVKQWINPEAEAPKNPELEEGRYARVTGALKPAGGKRFVAGTTLRLVTDMNEINYHFLEAVAVHLHYTRGPVDQFMAGGGARKAVTSGVDVAMGGMGGGGGSGASFAGLSRHAATVLQFIKNENNNEGVAVEQISVRTKLGLSEVLKAKDELVNEGRAFTTVDENHIAPMDYD